jgi:Protein of unknown function DUF58
MMTQRGTATLSLGLSLCIGAWVLSLPELVAAGAALLALVLVALIWVWAPGSGKPHLVASVQPSPTLAHSTVGVAISLQLKGIRPAVVRAPISDGRRVRIWSRPGRAGHRSGSFPLAVGDRGDLSVGPFSVHRYDPLGLARRRLGTSGSSDVVVWPEMTPATPVRPTLGASKTSPSRATSAPTLKSSSTELEAAGLRPYVLGDELRLVHWTASARGRGMLVRTFEPAAVAIPLVVFDDRTTSHTAESFEYSLCVVASLIGATHSIGSGETSARLVFWSDLDESGANADDVALWGPDAFTALARAIPAISASIRFRHDSPGADVVVSGPTTKTGAADAHHNSRQGFLVVDPDNSSEHVMSSLDNMMQWERFVR